MAASKDVKMSVERSKAFLRFFESSGSHPEIAQRLQQNAGQ